MTKQLLLALALCLSACASRSTGRDTARLTRNIGNAQASVENAQRATDTIGGNIGRARTAAERSDAKTLVVLKWLRAQEEYRRAPK